MRTRIMQTRWSTTEDSKVLNQTQKLIKLFVFRFLCNKKNLKPLQKKNLFKLFFIINFYFNFYADSFLFVCLLVCWFIVKVTKFDGILYYCVSYFGGYSTIKAPSQSITNINYLYNAVSFCELVSLAHTFFEHEMRRKKNLIVNESNLS